MTDHEDLRRRFERLAERYDRGERTHELATSLLHLAELLEQYVESPSPDYARSLLDRAREARSMAERLLLRRSERCPC